MIEGVLQGFQKKLKNDDNGDDDSSYMSVDTDDDSRQSFNDDDSVTSEGSDSSFETEVDSDENFNPKEKPSKGDISSEDDEVNGIKGLTVAELVENFIKLYKKFECERAKDQKSILVSMLDELMRQKGISKEHYCFLKGRIKKR